MPKDQFNVNVDTESYPDSKYKLRKLTATKNIVRERNNRIRSVTVPRISNIR